MTCDGAGGEEQPLSGFPFLVTLWLPAKRVQAVGTAVEHCENWPLLPLVNCQIDIAARERCDKVQWMRGPPPGKHRTGVGGVAARNWGHVGIFLGQEAWWWHTRLCVSITRRVDDLVSV